MERAIQRLTDALDIMDAADEDLELSGDELEPLLGAAEGLFGWSPNPGSASFGADECEVTDEDGGHVCDVPHDADAPEPDLGSLDAQEDQRRWADGQYLEAGVSGPGPMPIRKLGRAGSDGVGDPSATAFLAAGRNRLRVVKHVR
jgi:hypothetical protein